LLHNRLSIIAFEDLSRSSVFIVPLHIIFVQFRAVNQASYRQLMNAQ